MHQLSRKRFIPVVLTSALLVAALGACRPKAPETPPAPTPPAPETAAPAEPVAAEPAPSTASSGAPSAPGSATAPVAANAAQGPDLATMSLASTTTKLGVPVDLRYSFEGAVEAGRPVTLHIAAVPRAAGDNMTVTIKDEAGLQVVAAPIRAQKAAAGTAYRQQLSITRAADGPAEVRVLVTMDMPIGQAHSWFSVPLAAAAAAGGKSVAEIR